LELNLKISMIAIYVFSFSFHELFFVIVAGLEKMNVIHNEIKKENKKKRSIKEKTLKSEIDHLKMISSQTFEKINK